MRINTFLSFSAGEPEDEDVVGDRNKNLDRDETDNMAGLLAPAMDVFASLETKKGPDVFTDFVSLSFYFFQMFLLIRMRESIVLEHLATQARVIYSSVFTLSIEMNSDPLVLCPLPNLTAISKLLLIKSFSFYVLGLMFLFHTCVYLIQLKDCLLYTSPSPRDRG